MKTLINLFALLLLTGTFAFAGSGNNDLSSYESSEISYTVEKRGGMVYIALDIENLDAYEAIEIVRSDSPVSGYSRVLYFSESDVKKLATDNVVVDRYPLPSTTPSYYKVVVSEKNGPYKQLPGVLIAAK